MKRFNQFSALSTAQRLVIDSSNLLRRKMQAPRGLWNEVHQRGHDDGELWTDLVPAFISAIPNPFSLSGPQRHFPKQNRFSFSLSFSGPYRLKCSKSRTIRPSGSFCLDYSL